MEDPDRNIAASLTDSERLKVCSSRLLLAQTYIQMKHVGFDALLAHGINYRELAEYKDQSLVEEAKRVSLNRGQELYIEWCRRVEHGISAAIKRKSFRKV